ncbi:DNA primase family protein [Paracoccus sulfuroxidans]|uniref:P4 family phage/plasmid primase-like protein n=1 Tax=Paracoccus sulfuroxidans TaxID=384678 RepID=A0A562P175_9RHOB|nr:phage/plasmid primase, P4 family [Paracoccus sulfuroxidans]TWI38238.1 P4 family phage/plasmid primase-like protein [Paracoccus sulfuroxidans]
MNIFEKFENALDREPTMTVDRFCSTLEHTELGNAYRIQIRHGDVLRFSRESASWIAYNGVAWQRNSNHEAMKRVEDMIHAIDVEKAHNPFLAADDEDGRKKRDEWKSEMTKHARRSQSKNAMKSALSLAETGLIADEADFDRKPELLNTPDGTVCLKDGRVYPNDPKDMLTGVTLMTYDPKAARADWEAFITDICKDRNGRHDPAKEAYLKVALGYSLFAHNERSLFFFITGDDRDETRNGRNGKTVLMDAVAAAIGPDYVRRFESRMLCRHNGKAPEATDRLPLIGSRIAFCSELNPSDVLDTATMKAVTGESETYVRSLHANAKSIRTTATPWLLTNHLPKISENDQAVWSRVRRIRFLNYFWNGEGQEPKGHWQALDTGLLDRLKKEASGILSWLIEGAVEYATNGFPEYADAMDSLSKTREEADPVGDFLSSCVSKGDNARVTSKEIYAAYVTYCSENGAEPMSVTAFGKAMNAKGFDSVKIGGVVYRAGIRFTVIGRAYAEGNDPRGAIDFIAQAEDGERLAGTEMSDEDLSRVPEHASIGDAFTSESGKVFKIVKAGHAIELENANVIPFKKSARR